MKIYHGTISVLNGIHLNSTGSSKDFGDGVYLSSNIEQATKIADRLHEKSSRSGEHSQKIIYCFDIGLDNMRRQLNVKEFRKSTEEWMDLVTAFRAGIESGKYDVIIGPTVGNEGWRILNKECFIHFDNNINKFYRTKEDKEIIADKIKTYIYGTQYCFKNEKAFRWLENYFIGRRIVC